MNNFLIAFITGLTTGGLSCLAIQGGLLASSLAQQAEQSIHQQLSAQSTAKQGNKKNSKQTGVAVSSLPPNRFPGNDHQFLSGRQVSCLHDAWIWFGLVRFDFAANPNNANCYASPDKGPD